MNDTVLYWDGASTMDLAEVVSIDKEHSRAKLSNGIILHRSPDKEGVFHRADYKEALEEQESKRRKKKNPVMLTTISFAWKYGTGNTEKVWKAYCFHKSFENTYKKLEEKVHFINVENIVWDADTIEFLEKVERKISKLI